VNTYSRPPAPRRRVNQVAVSIGGDCFGEIKASGEMLLSLLDDELQSIIKRDAPRLIDISNEKQRCLGTLESMSREIATRGLVMNEQLRGMLARWREHNIRNGELLRTPRRHCERTLQILRGSNEQSTVYDGGGSPQSQTSARYRIQA
jgi:flagellar biosynthesis/type III secretory pathway chaperone